jgi:diguanylate cyclase (GGDEF)-like protein/PAS domain S-box-containing protein
MFNLSPDPAWIIEDNKFVECNDAAVRHLGYASRNELLNLHPSALSPHKQPDGEESFSKAERMMSIANEVGINRFEWVHTKADGENFIAEVTLSKMELDGKSHFYCVWRDITERLESEEVWKFALEASGDGVWNYDFRTGKNIVSKRLMEMLGIIVPASESVHFLNDWVERLHPDSAAMTMKAFEDVVSNKADTYVVEQQLRCEDGTFKWMLTRGKVTLRDEEGKPLRMIGTASDITERKVMEEQIRQLAFYDTLTDLPNRSMLMERLTYSLAQSKRTGRHGALMFIDLDNFKPLNDQYGHNVGDLLLIEVAKRLSSSMREVDTVARFGGDEFVVILNDLETDETEATEQANNVAVKILSILGEPYEITLPDGVSEKMIAHHCTASIGVAMFINHEASQEDLLKWADMAMYQAKDAGRNIVKFYTAPH